MSRLVRHKSEPLDRRRRSVSLTVEGAPPNWSNTRLHYMVRYSAMDGWRRLVAMAAHGARAQAGWPLPARHTQRRWVTVTIYRRRLLDEDNAVASIKPCIDGLKGALIYDDSPAWCHLRRVNQVLVRGREPERTVITVCLVDPEAAA